MLEMLLRKQDAPPYKAVHIEFPASEFEFQEKLDSIDKNELQTFCAAASVKQPKTVADLINLTYNTHCRRVSLLRK